MGPCPRDLPRFRRGIFPRSSRAREVYRTPFYHSITPRSLFSALLPRTEPVLNLQVQGEPGRPVCVSGHVRRWTSQHRMIHFGLQAPSGSIYFLIVAPKQFPLLVFLSPSSSSSSSPNTRQTAPPLRACPVLPSTLQYQRPLSSPAWITLQHDWKHHSSRNRRHVCPVLRANHHYSSGM